MFKDSSHHAIDSQNPKLPLLDVESSDIVEVLDLSVELGPTLQRRKPDSYDFQGTSCHSLSQ